MKSSWLYTLLAKPQLYLFTILKHTAFVGLVTLILCYWYFHSSYNQIKIPTITHTLISVAIGFLLVFRTQTAYDRWSTASKNFYELQAHFTLLMFRVKNIGNNYYSEIKIHVDSYCDNFALYLNEIDLNKSLVYEKLYIESLGNILSTLSLIKKNSPQIDASDINYLVKVINDILIISSSCSRIKNTPIPKSYEMHIKVSVFLYICSLPFGLFYDMGLWSVLMVMFVYYIMAGIEIISREIENPFEDAPNDLPVKEYMNKIKNIFKN